MVVTAGDVSPQLLIAAGSSRAMPSCTHSLACVRTLMQHTMSVQCTECMHLLACTRTLVQHVRRTHSQACNHTGECTTQRSNDALSLRPDARAISACASADTVFASPEGRCARPVRPPLSPLAPSTSPATPFLVLNKDSLSAQKGKLRVFLVHLLAKCVFTMDGLGSQQCAPDSPVMLQIIFET